MKFKQKKSSKPILSDKIADALTVKPRADIEDDHIFNTKPSTLSRVDFSSSDSEDEAAISDFRKRNVNLLSEISKKYEGQVVSRKEIEAENSEGGSSSDEDPNIYNTSLSEKKSKAEELSNSDSAEESDDYSITNNLKQLNDSSDEEDGDDADEDSNDGSDDEEDDDEGEGYDISQMDEPVKEEFEHVKKQNISEEAKKGACVRNQLLIWEGLLEMRIHLQRCMNSANRMPMSDTYNELKSSSEFVDEANVTINNVATLLDKFLTLQNLLLKNFPETKTLSSNKQTSEQKTTANNASDEEIPSDTDNEEIPSDTDDEDNVVQEKKTKCCQENTTKETQAGRLRE